MNIVIITPKYPVPEREDLPSDTSAVHYFAREWIKEGHNVLVFNFFLHSVKRFIPNLVKNVLKTPPSPADDYCYIIDGVDVVFREFNFHFPKQRMAGARHINIMGGIVCRHMKERKFAADVVLCHFPTNFPGLMKYLPVEIKKIAVLHNADIKTTRQRFHFLLKEKVFKHYTDIYFRSERIKKDYMHYCGDDFKYGSVVYSGFPSQLLPHEPSYRNFKGPFKLIFAGKLVKLKNIKLIIEALSKIKDVFDFSFTIIGEGSEENLLKKLVSKLNLESRVTFMGQLTRKRVIELMSEADIFVMPSSPETLGLVYLEAMGCGCLTIGTKNEGIDGIIKDGINGFLVDLNKENHLSDIFLKIKNSSPDDLSKISENAIKTAGDNTEKKAAARYLSKIKETIDAGRVEDNE